MNNFPDYPAPGAFLSVSDIEKLAKAGVKIDFADIRYQVKTDDEMPRQARPWPSLADSFWERWRRANPPSLSTFDGTPAPWTIYAHSYDGTVYVLVCPNDSVPFVLTDPALLYPSDALMAALHLQVKTK